MSVLAKIQSLTKQLYPTGRVFKMPSNGFLEKLTNGLAVSEAKAYSDSLSLMDSAIPDNDTFDLSDALSWERRLGLITNLSVSLANRKLAIKSKMNHPGTVKARQHYLFLERQLQAVGFAVNVYENRFDDGGGGLETRSPITVGGGAGLDENQLNEFQLGDAQLGGSFSGVIANNIYAGKDSVFDVGDNLRFTFFIGGSPIGTLAEVDEGRELEFRQLVLRTKPLHTVAYLFVNFV